MWGRTTGFDKLRPSWALAVLLVIVGGGAFPALAEEDPASESSSGRLQEIAEIIFKAQQCLREDKPDDALELLDEALSGDSEGAFWQSALLYWRGETLERLSRESEAIQSYQEIVDENNSGTFGVLAASRLAILSPKADARKLTSAADANDKLEVRRLKVMFLTRAAVGGDSQAAAELMSMAGESEFASTRKAAIQGLASVRDPDVDEFLAELVEREPDPGVIKAALYVIASRNSPKSVDVLKRVVTSSGDESLQVTAIQALVYQRDPGISVFLKGLLKEEGPRQVKVNSLQCLHGRSEIEVSELLDILDDEKDNEVRLKAAQILSLMDASKGLDAEQLGRIRDLAVRESDRRAWTYQIMAISKISDPASVRVLSELLERTPDSEDRNHIIRAIFATGSPAVVEALRDILIKVELDETNLQTLARGLVTLRSLEVFSLLDDVYSAGDDPESQETVIRATLSLARQLRQCQRGAELLMDFSSRARNTDVTKTIIMALMELDCEEARDGAGSLMEEMED